MNAKRSKTPPAPPAEEEPAAIYVRNVDALREVRAVPRMRALAKSAGASEAQIARALIVLGLAQAEADPAALLRAFKTAA